MPNDVASAKAVLAEHGYIAVHVGMDPLPPFDENSMPPTIRNAFFTSGEKWASALSQVLLAYKGLCRAQEETAADLERGVGFDG